MTREYLKSLGLSDEQIDKIMAEHGKTVGTLTQNVETLTAERDDLKNQAAETSKSLDELKKDAKELPELKAKIENMEAEQTKSQEASTANIAAIKKDYEVKIALTNAGAKNDKAVKALLDLDAVTIDDKGNVLGLGEQLESLKGDEATSFLFKEDEKPTPPEDKKGKITFGENSNGGTPPSDPFEAVFNKLNEKG